MNGTFKTRSSQNVANVPGTVQKGTSQMLYRFQLKAEIGKRYQGVMPGYL